MKKLILILAAVFCCTFANAQWYMGGGFGITRGYEGHGLSLNIYPDIVYRFDNVLAAGAQISYRTGYPGFGVTPYARVHVLRAEQRLSLFLCAAAPMRFENDYKSVGFSIRPGFSLRVSKRVHLVGYLGDLGYSQVTSAGVTTGGWRASLGRDDINMGFCVAL